MDILYIMEIFLFIGIVTLFLVGGWIALAPIVEWGSYLYYIYNYTQSGGSGKEELAIEWLAG
uniref:Uncharacterized protein n=1 Tax=Picea glauca TaxID=3330 RepID=A0A101LVP9_PICGL|nr:hypothetical protein ABT39_MTgene2017 [Picea glauca]